MIDTIRVRLSTSWTEQTPWLLMILVIILAVEEVERTEER